MPAISAETIRQKCIQEPWIASQTRGHIKFGTVPEWFEGIAKNLPAGSVERQDYLDASYMARDIYREQIRAQIDPTTLDSIKVTEMCTQEPWTTANSIETLSNGTFGYVTEKLERARNSFPEHSAEYMAYDDAFEKAKVLYFDGIKQHARQFATGKTRAQIEEVNANLWAQAGRLEGNGTYLRSRLIKVCEWNGVYFYQTGKQLPRDSGVHQMVARPRP